jgi:hypothetical protein
MTKNNHGYIPLHEAIRAGNLEDFTTLIGRESVVNEVNKSNKFGDTALHLAAISENSAFAKALIKIGANVNATNSDDFTPLHLAILCNNKNTVGELLSSSEVKLDARDKNDRTPLNLAIEVNNFEGAEALIRAGAKSSPMDLAYIEKRQNEFNDIKNYIENSSEINAKKLVANINKAQLNDDDKFLLIIGLFQSKALISSLDFAKIVKGIFEQDVDKTRCLLLTLKELSPEQTIFMCKEDRRGSSKIRDFMNNLELESDDAKETIFTQFIKNMGGSITQKNVETIITGIGIKDLDIFKIIVTNSEEIEGPIKGIITESINNLSKTASVGTTKRPNTLPVFDEPSEDEKKASISKVEQWLSENVNPKEKPITSPRPTSFSQAALSERKSSKGSYNGSEFSA